MMFNYIMLLIFGMILLIKGANLLVKGSSGIATIFKISPMIIGLTIVSIGTSLPELSVNIISSIKGLDDISIGNIIGSNIFDIFIVLGISAIITPLIISKDMKKYDIPILLLIYIILGLFMFIITPNKISIIEGIIILIIMVLYTILLVIRNIHKKPIIEESKEILPWYKYILMFIIGLVFLILGAKLVVDNSSGLALSLGMSELLVSLTMISIGTSLPEVTTSIIAVKNKEYDIAIGNGVGSCIYNILLIIGLSVVIHPISIPSYILIDYLIMLSSVVLLMIAVINKNKIDRINGITYIFIYLCYIAYIIIRNYI